MRMVDVNVFNTDKTMRQAAAAGARKYFCVSTDKAANPVNMMGASKRIMEYFLMRRSDRFGRKPLIVASLMISTPFFFAFLATQGIWSVIFLALAGASLLSSFSVTVVAAQEAIPENKALAAGISMGLIAARCGRRLRMHAGEIAEVVSG